MGQAPVPSCGLSWQPVHFRGAASLHCVQHHFPAYTTSLNGNGRHRATSASASAIATPTHRSHIHRMAVPPRVNPAERIYQCSLAGGRAQGRNLTFRVGFREQMEVEMDDEIARLRVHHIESLRSLAMALENLAKDANGLLRQWEAELNPETEPPAQKFEPPITEKRVK